MTLPSGLLALVEVDDIAKEELMGTIQRSIKQYSVLLYFLFTFILSWGSILAITGPNGLPLTLEQSAQVWPLLLYLAMLIGPPVAGLLLIGLVEGRIGLHGLWVRLVRWRVGIRWYAVALLMAPLSVAIAVLLLSHFPQNTCPRSSRRTRRGPCC